MQCSRLAIFYPIIDPMTYSDASVWIWNGIDQSGPFKTSAMVRSFLSYRKDSLHSGVQMNSASLVNNVYKELEILLKSFMKRL